MSEMRVRPAFSALLRPMRIPLAPVSALRALVANSPIADVRDARQTSLFRALATDEDPAGSCIQQQVSVAVVHLDGQTITVNALRSVGHPLQLGISLLYLADQPAGVYGFINGGLEEFEIVLQMLSILRIVGMGAGEIRLDGCQSFAARKCIKPPALDFGIVGSNLMRHL